ncbi:GNAT family N-acetyltransferase [Streptomyces sp. NPDC051561]|uniref:GNAT family N-acetyltransferase n=1 Tax=Streptomyces sp. NPDC051561 TaxID=3365658 RepID=UPI0037B97A29
MTALPSAPTPAASAPAPAPAPQDFVRTTLDLGDARLRPWSRADIGSPTVDALIAASTDEAIALWNPLPTADRDAATKWLEARDDAWGKGTLATFALAESTRPDTLLGALTVRWTDRADGLGMIGYWLVPAARGRGLATRATRVAADWAFRTAGVRRLELAHAVENEASCRVAERCGFPAEGVLRASYRFGDGEYHDEHLHARLWSDREQVTTDR